MQPGQDPYQVLGVDRRASDHEIEKLWKRRRNRLQPRSERGDEEAERELQVLNAAWLAIGDMRARERADAEPMPGPSPAGTPSCAGRAAPPPRQQTAGVVVSTIQLGPEPPPWQDPLGQRQRNIHVELSLPWLLALRGGPCYVHVDLGEHVRSVDLVVPASCTREHRWSSGGGGIRGGDLFLSVKEVRPHPHFRSDGHGNIHMQLRVAFADIYRGADLAVPGPWGDVAITLLPGRREPLRIVGHGHRTAARRGDLIVVLEVHDPEVGNAELGDLLRRVQAGVTPEPIRLR